MAEYDLDLVGFSNWAREQGGRPLRDDNDEVIRQEGSEGRPGEPLGGSIEEQTLKQELAVLNQFQTTMRINKLDPNNSEALYEGLSRFYVYLTTRTIKGRPEADRLSKTTIERYLIVIRRYMRFAGRPAGARTVPGPYIPRPKKTPIRSTAFNAWIQALPDDDDRLAIVTWLLVSGVSVGSLDKLRYGDQVKVNQEKVTIVVDLETIRPAGELEELLLRGYAATGGRGSLFLSQARRHHGTQPDMTLSGIRAMWTDFRKRLAPVGPTMSEIAVVGRKVNLRRHGRNWIYELRE